MNEYKIGINLKKCGISVASPPTSSFKGLFWMYPGLSKEAHYIEDRFEVLKSQYMKKVVAIEH